MIKTMKNFLTAVLLFSVTFMSAQNIQQYIPKDATFVVTMNLNHLNNKVNLLELQQYPFYEMMVGQMAMGGGNDAEMMEAMLTEPSKLGLNIMEKAYLYGVMDGEIMRFNLIAAVSDKQALVKTIEATYAEENIEVQQMNGFSYMVPGDDLTVAWNDKVLMMGAVERKDSEEDYPYEEYAEEYAEEEEVEVETMPDFEEMEIEEEEMDVLEEEIVFIDTSIEEEPMPESLEEITEDMLEAPVEEPMTEFNFVDDLDPELQAITLAWMKTNLNRTADNSIAINPRFVKGVNSNDMHVWLDYAFVMEMIQEQQGEATGFMDDNAKMGMEMMQTLMGSMYDDAYLSIGMNFNDGRWVLDASQYMNPKLTKMMTGTFDSKYNKKMVKHLRGDELLGIYHINMNMEKMVDGYKELAKDIATEVPMYGSMVESALEIIGIFIDEKGISNVFNGDMIFAVTGMQSVTRMETVVEYDDNFNPTETEQEVTSEIPEMTFMMSYGNEKDIMKFVRLGAKASVLQQAGQNFKISIPNMDMEATLAVRDGILFVSNSQDLINSNFSKKYKGKQKIDKALCKTMCQSAQVMYFDIPQMIASLKAEEMAGAMGAGDFVNIGKQNFESMMITTSKTLVDGAFRSEMSLNMTDKETNALKQIFEIINEVMETAMGGSGSKT
ncbi:MAG: hypothetical protein ACI9XO_001984 [Paraglaciecola sp.]|jgi:hypothetical protein